VHARKLAAERNRLNDKTTASPPQHAVHRTMFVI
jgi:hypothetical protein